MRERLKTLQHLLGVYRQIEDAYHAEAERAAGEVQTVKAAIDREQQSKCTAVEEERMSVSRGDAVGRIYAMANQMIAATARVKLDRLRVEREERSHASQRRYLGSRLWSERMQSLTDKLEADARRTEERQTQAAVDEYNLAQRRRRESVRGRVRES